MFGFFGCGFSEGKSSLSDFPQAAEHSARHMADAQYMCGLPGLWPAVSMCLRRCGEVATVPSHPVPGSVPPFWQSQRPVSGREKLVLKLRKGNHMYTATGSCSCSTPVGGFSLKGKALWLVGTHRSCIS